MYNYVTFFCFSYKKNCGKRKKTIKLALLKISVKNEKSQEQPRIS